MSTAAVLSKLIGAAYKTLGFKNHAKLVIIKLLQQMSLLIQRVENICAVSYHLSLALEVKMQCNDVKSS